MILERMGLYRNRDLLKWLFCCLFFRFYPILPRVVQVKLFNEVVGPFYRLIEPEIEKIDRIVLESQRG